MICQFHNFLLNVFRTYHIYLERYEVRTYLATKSIKNLNQMGTLFLEILTVPPPPPLYLPESIHCNFYTVASFENCSIMIHLTWECPRLCCNCMLRNGNLYGANLTCWAGHRSLIVGVGDSYATLTLLFQAFWYPHLLPRGVEPTPQLDHQLSQKQFPLWTWNFAGY